jgi:hypothetical protein
MTRYFQVPEGRTLVLPQGVQAGPGATNMRFRSGAILVLEDEQLVANQRYINGRLRAGDLAELDDTKGAAAAKAQADEIEKAAKVKAASKLVETLPKADPTKPMAKPGTDEAENRAIERTANAVTKKGS